MKISECTMYLEHKRICFFPNLLICNCIRIVKLHVQEQVHKRYGAFPTHEQFVFLLCLMDCILVSCFRDLSFSGFDNLNTLEIKLLLIQDGLGIASAIKSSHR